MFFYLNNKEKLMSKELYKKVKSFISEIEDLEHWWKFSSKVKENFEPIQEVFEKNLSNIKLNEVNESLEKSVVLNSLSTTLTKEYENEIVAFKTILLKTQSLAEKSIEMLTKALVSEQEELEATNIIKEMDSTVSSLEKFESLNVHPTLESFINQAIKASHLVLNAKEEDFSQIIPNLQKVKDSLEDIDNQLNEMKNQTQDRQYSLRFAFSDLNRSLNQLADDFRNKEE
jgi:hypothetical protein